MISREISEAFMPSCPIAMPSETAMVTNSRGVPPAAVTPALAALAWRSRVRLHGVASFHVLATPTHGLRMSSSVSPMARKNARCGARCLPSVTVVLRGRFISVNLQKACPVAYCAGGKIEREVKRLARVRATRSKRTHDRGSYPQDPELGKLSFFQLSIG